MVQKVELRPYLDNLAAEANPIFRNRWLSLGDRLLEDAEINATAVGRSLRIHTILSLGATGTGVGFHSHTENWLYLRTTGLGSYTMGPWYADETRTDWLQCTQYKDDRRQRRGLLLA